MLLRASLGAAPLALATLVCCSAIFKATAQDPVALANTAVIAPKPPRDVDLTQMVIYELNPKGFAESYAKRREGDSPWVVVKDAVLYFRQLGARGIWLAGYCLANDHFYDVWSVYATVRPDVLDPSLGTEGEFRDFIKAAHEVGLKVFLDVIS